MKFPNYHLLEIPSSIPILVKGKFFIFFWVLILFKGLSISSKCYTTVLIFFSECFDFY